MDDADVKTAFLDQAKPATIVQVEKPQQDDNFELTYCWKDLTVTAQAPRGGCCDRFKKVPVKQPKTILQNVSGIAKPGELLAIMGASGAGKSSLLNALTFRNLKGLRITTGLRMANGMELSSSSLTSMSAYVQQQDLFIGTLTVREHLTFQSLVRIDRKVSNSERQKKVEQVMHDFSLTKCADVVIGVTGKIKGISGGEKKRLAFASEVLTNPSLMFCDEPTSGLDSFMAQTVVESIRNMAKMKNKTVICTIHQPSSEIIELFDSILLMSEGRVVFQGSLKQGNEFFDSAGYPCPLNYNPSDHYIRTLALIPGQEDTCREKLNKLYSDFEASEINAERLRAIDTEETRAKRASNGHGVAFKKGDDLSGSPYKVSWFSQFRALLWRSWLASIKDPLVTRVRLTQTIGVALILGLIYFGQENNQQGIININGAIFVALINNSFSGVFSVVKGFCIEIPVFLREHFNGMYRTDVYYLSKQLAELPIFILMPVIFMSIFYFMVGMNPDVERFFYALVTYILVVQCATSFGYALSCVSSSLDVTLALTPALMMPLLLFGGFFLRAKSSPAWISWLEYVSWFSYANEAIIVNQWKGVENITCSVAKKASSCITQGDQVIANFGYDSGFEYYNLLIMLALSIAFRVIGFFALLKKTYTKNR